MIKPYFKINKDITGLSWDQDGCMPRRGLTLDKTQEFFFTGRDAQIRLPSGECILLNQTLNAHFTVDLNGQKEPNILGKDIFYFHLMPKKRDVLSPDITKSGGLIGQNIVIYVQVMDGWREYLADFGF